MKSDVNGCSNCPTGSENYEEFNINEGQRKREEIMVQYDYRHTDGKLFSIVRATLESCRELRDKWLSKHTQNA